MNKEEQIKFIEDNYPMEKHVRSKRYTRHTFFSKIETEIQAYLLGLYASDGNINEKRKTFRIHLSYEDAYIVNYFRDIICPTARTFVIERGKQKIGRHGEIYECATIYGVDINSTTLCQDLVMLGLGYRKTWAENHIPNIPEALIPHFIRGYFDGDGCISGHYIKPDLKYKKNERFRANFSIVAKTRSMLEDIKREFEKNNIKCNICHTNRDDMFTLSAATSQLSKVYNYLYKDANFFMKRKYNKFSHYVNTEVTQLIAEYRNAQKVNVKESNNPSTSAEHPTKDENVRWTSGKPEESSDKKLMR